MLPCGMCARHVRAGEVRCPFCREDPGERELCPVRSRGPVRGAMAAALAGIGGALSADAGTLDGLDGLGEHARQRREYDRGAIAQGRTRYGGPPGPRPTPPVQVRLRAEVNVTGPATADRYEQRWRRWETRFGHCVRRGLNDTHPDTAAFDGLAFEMRVWLDAGATQDRTATVRLSPPPGRPTDGASLDRVRRCLETEVRRIVFEPVPEGPVEVAWRGSFSVRRSSPIELDHVIDSM
jgi:hypothetical protein